jgi:hypothetical protein
MEVFYLNVKLNWAMPRIKVDEVLPEQRDMLGAPQFIIRFQNSRGFTTLIMQWKNSQRYERNTRLSKDDSYLD